MNVMLGSFAKKRNSTALPSGGQTSISGTLRAGCSIQNPIIGFAENRMSTPAAYNYAYITQFGRYYFIQDWKWEGGLWWAYMEVDVMGSFKTPIGQSSCYVLRAASDYDNTITDGLYPSTAFSYGYSPAEYEDYLDVHSLTEGTYIVGVIGQGDGGSVGAVNYYALTPTSMSTFRSQLLTDTTFVGITEITNELLKALLNPFQYVVSCVWFPIKYTDISGSTVSSIKLGWWTITSSAKAVSTFTYNLLNQTIAVYAVQKATDDGGGFRYSAPFSSYTLIMPPFGEINLDSQIIGERIDYSLQGSTRISFTLKIDLISGNGYMELWCGDYTLGFYEGKFGVPCQLGQITQNVGGAAVNLLEAGTAISNTSGVGMVAGLAGSVLSGSQNIAPKVTTRGLNAGITLFSYGAYVTSKYNPPVIGNSDENGKPLFQTKTINTLQGYIKTMNSDIAITGATDAEQEQIRTMMNGGFFYE